MSARTQWRVIDGAGVTSWSPEPVARGDYFSCADGRDGSNFGTPRQAVMWWVLFRTSVDAAEIVAPGDLSAAEREHAMHERCVDACDELFSELEHGSENAGGEVTFVIDDAHGTDTAVWSAEECERALDGVRLAQSAVGLVTAIGDSDV